MVSSNSIIPVSLITGFLGSGKTTLLNSLINQGNLTNVAFVINEFGDVGIDQLLVESADEGVIELSDGCLCCTIRGDLVDTLSRLLNRTDSLVERIIIETTGLADPAPILHTIMGHPVLCERLRLDGVITVVDAINGMATLDTHEEAVKQAAVADRLVISKTDISDTAELIKQRLVAINPTARIVDNQNNPNFQQLFECGLYDPTTKSMDVQNWLNSAAHEQELEHHHGHHHSHDHGHSHHDVNRHDARIRSFSLKTDTPVSAASLATFLDLLRSAHGPNLLRVKGIVKILEDPDRPVVLHGVQQIFHPPATLPNWPDEERSTRLVMITRDLPESFVQKLFDAFVGKASPDTPDQQALNNNPLAVPGYSGDFK